MVRKFTEEERARQMEGIKRHEERFHGGEVTRCNYYSECWKTEREEWAAQDKAVRNA